jgi:hypothetical protein
MRLAALLVTAILGAAPAAAQPPQSYAPGTPASPAQDAQATNAKPLNLPVSLDKIRDALAQPFTPSLKGMDERPMFRVEIQERQKIDELLQTLTFKSGPPVPGGIYGYEQQRIAFPAVNNPLMQPYAAFTPGEMMQVTLTSIVEQYLAKKVISGIASAVRSSAEQAAREDVRHAIEDYCAAQPHGGAGIQICDYPPIR